MNDGETTIRNPAAPALLDPTLLAVMVSGPNAAGKTLWDFDHEMLRSIWAAHETTIRAEAARRQVEPWFVGRDRFVAFIEDGTPLVDADEDDNEAD